MDINDGSGTPRLVEGVDTRALSIGPEEAFVLSRVDGLSSEADIALATGIEQERVRDALMRLLDLGAIRFEAPPPPPRRGTSGELTEVRRHSLRLGRPVIESFSSEPVSHHPAAALYDPAELDEETDLELARKRQILDLFYKLDNVDFYQLLGLKADADKKAVKAAYYKVVTTFHPDRYFGKQLGSFKTKLEQIFGRLTEAHDTLTRKGSLAEYDAYLQTLERNASEADLLQDEAAAAAEAERIRRQIEEEARVAERAEHLKPVPSVRPLDEAVRRKSLARKLGRFSGRPGSPSASSAPPPVDVERAREAVAAELKRHYETHFMNARELQIKRYLHTAEQETEKGNPVAAANALRIATSLAPEDADIALRLAESQKAAHAHLAGGYREQAMYEERHQMWAQAAHSYEKASLGDPSPKLLERVAFCLLEDQGDLKKASDFAKRAVLFEPEHAGFRVTLARVYLAAKMVQSALSEFERARLLSPDDDTIKEHIQRIKRDEV